MARITVEDCLAREPSIYALVHLTIRRARQLQEGDTSVVPSPHKPIVTALREIAAGKVRFRTA
jgi:DNA-directed RNA polymerase subunit omega